MRGTGAPTLRIDNQAAHCSANAHTRLSPTATGRVGLPWASCQNRLPQNIAGVVIACVARATSMRALKLSAS